MTAPEVGVQQMDYLLILLYTCIQAHCTFDIQKFFARCINLDVLDLQTLQKFRRDNRWQGLMTADDG